MVAAHAKPNGLLRHDHQKGIVLPVHSAFCQNIATVSPLICQFILLGSDVKAIVGWLDSTMARVPCAGGRAV